MNFDQTESYIDIRNSVFAILLFNFYVFSHKTDSASSKPVSLTGGKSSHLTYPGSQHQPPHKI
jgi:hypothetical protein